MKIFNKGQDYSRSEINHHVGGSIQSYLPDVNGQVVAGCFRLDTNPEAPNVILPGYGPKIQNAANMFVNGNRPIPVFIKQDVNRWRYVGMYRGTGNLGT
jgi:hypothetical protein